jgi:hypothetical protein
MLSVPVCNLRGGHAATIRALGAVNGILNGFRDGFETSLYKIVALHPGPEALVFFSLSFPETLDLHEVG